jgi:hypothetical protein
MRRVWNARLAIADVRVSRRRVAAYFFRRPIVAAGRQSRSQRKTVLFKLEILGFCFIGEIV